MKKLITLLSVVTLAGSVQALNFGSIVSKGESTLKRAREDAGTTERKISKRKRVVSKAAVQKAAKLAKKEALIAKSDAKRLAAFAKKNAKFDKLEVRVMAIYRKLVDAIKSLRKLDSNLRDADKTLGTLFTKFGKIHGALGSLPGVKNHAIIPSQLPGGMKMPKAFKMPKNGFRL